MDAVPKTACPRCGGSGWAYDLINGVSGVVRCDCTKTDRTRRLLSDANIPARYARCDLNNFEIQPPHTTRSIEKAKLDAERFVEEYPVEQGLLFVGPQGVGKTHLAVGIIKRLIQTKGVPCLFWGFPDLLKEIQNSYNPVSQSSEYAVLNPVLWAEVLVLDELGAQNPSAWVRDIVGYVLNHRYNERKTTILTTNYSDPEDRAGRVAVAEALVDRIGVRMRSRIYEMCRTVKMDGTDFRRNVKTNEGLR